MGGKSSEAAAILPGPVHICGRAVILVILFPLIAVPCLIFYNDAYPLQFSRLSCHSDPSDSSPTPSQLKLERVPKAASMKDKTVILTALNEAWAAPNSILDLFLESFKIGENTKHLLSRLVTISLDQKAYERCLQLHPHCYALNVEGVDFTVEAYFMSEDYLKMVWSKIDIQRRDADVVWFREPFNRFYEDTDLQISCDNYLLNDSYSLANNPNSGFKYVKSNNRTKQFYKYWYESRIRYPNQHDQAVLVKLIKLSDPFIKKIALKIRFLSTLYFVCTMHANCCFGLESKIHDLNLMLDDWRHYKSLSLSDKSSYKPTWRTQDCRKKFDYHHLPKKVEHEGKKD
ncbi:hypothetical protein MKW98_005806 [Papaver atlanticum]|uniref:Nucleotide-diphospho-sugar transferase domain-containing protein n=1 Tax=Papaver atlanticum TaxID=357466 RepID=A0AAD4TKK9_9MAGN|nr:hypothetical protein MKW98_005806 [Papaver atlanticum]